MNKLRLKNEFDTLFDTMSKQMFIGFDDFFKDTDEVMKISNRCTLNFPPYNIYKKAISINSENSVGTEVHTFIELACAGIKKENLKVVLTPDNILTIKTEYKKAESDNKEYIHQGIAQRDFSFSRTLQPNMKIVKVTYEDGILLVELKMEKPESEFTEINIE